MKASIGFVTCTVLTNPPTSCRPLLKYAHLSIWRWDNERRADGACLCVSCMCASEHWICRCVWSGSEVHPGRLRVKGWGWCRLQSFQCKWGRTLEHADRPMALQGGAVVGETEGTSTGCGADVKFVDQTGTMSPWRLLVMHAGWGEPCPCHATFHVVPCRNSSEQCIPDHGLSTCCRATVCTIASGDDGPSCRERVCPSVPCHGAWDTNPALMPCQLDASACSTSTSKGRLCMCSDVPVRPPGRRGCVAEWSVARRGIP